jgi:hypothetical protein
MLLYKRIDNINTAEPSSSHIMAALCTEDRSTVHWLGGGGGCRATSQVFITQTNVNKIEDYNHLNSNQEQKFTTWEELFFCC